MILKWPPSSRWQSTWRSRSRLSRCPPWRDTKCKTPDSGPARAETPEKLAGPATGAPGKSVWPVYVTIALSGMTALGAEVVWTRLLSLMLGATVYAFSIILAVFLFGLGIGSSIGAALARRNAGAAAALGGCQLLLTAAIAWTAYMLAKSLPYWPINPSLTANPVVDVSTRSGPLPLGPSPGGDSVGREFSAGAGGCGGARAGRRAARRRRLRGQHRGRDPRRRSASACFSFRWPARSKPAVAHWHFRRGSAADVRLPCWRNGWRRPSPRSAVLLALVRWRRVVLAAPGAACRACRRNPRRTGRLWPYMATRLGEADMLYVGEGMNSSVAVSQEKQQGVRNFHVSGKVEASTEPQDMRLQRMLGHLPALFHPEPRSVLVVGCGAGVTAGSFVGASRRSEHRHLRNRTAGPASRGAMYFSPENHQRGERPAHDRWSMTTPGITSSPRATNSTSSPPTRSIRGSKAPPRFTRRSISSW